MDPKILCPELVCPIPALSAIIEPQENNMISTQQLNELGRQIAVQFGADRVVVFGSHADGSARPDSDIDLLVIAKTSLPPHKRYGAVRRLLADIPAAFDIIVKTPEEYRRARSVVNSIVYFAEKTGRVLYAG